MGISRQQALDCLRSDDLIGIGMESDALRRRLHPEGVVTYRCIHEVDVSSASLSIPESAAAIRLKYMESTRSSAISEFLRSGWKNPTSIWVEVALGAPVIFDPRVREEIARLAACGVNSIAVCASHKTEDHAPAFAVSLEIHRAAHAIGMSTTIAIPFGCGESLVTRLDMLDAVRQLQDESGGFIALMPLALDAPAGRRLEGVTAVEQLKMLAVTRMYLDSIPHMQSPQIGTGLKVLQTGLRFGADDAELQLPQRGITESELRRVVRDAGFMPVERDGTYTTMFLSS